MKSTSDYEEKYLNLLRDILTGELLQDGKCCGRILRRFMRLLGLQVSRPMNWWERQHGRVWPAHALTMVGTKRLDNIRHCIETCEREGIPGDFVECGVWRGGASIYAAAVIAVLRSQRHVWACDSFEGLPKPTLKNDILDRIHLFKDKDVLGISYDEVWQNFCRFHLDYSNVHLVRGWFSETLKDLPITHIAVLRADGDMYESTRDILELIPRVVPGGFIIVDDYGDIAGCQEATDEALANHKHGPITWIDEGGIFWRKE